ncbi:MAG: glycosyltransferase family 2 protein [Candidatus Omnitrophica bacterium]|nr:glycosyltransferase family 2 protein [Candidatus Omnitrophota bacterium]
MRLSVVIPVYNEKGTIFKIIDRVLQESMVSEVIVVDDYSVDGTKELLKERKLDPKVKLFFHDRNKGKGAALRTGFKEVSCDVVIVQDADLEYDPSDYKNLMIPIERGDADVVYGTRLSGGRPQRVHMFWHKVGNNVISIIADILFNATLTDIETGYKMIRTSLLKELNIKSNGFGFEPEFTAKVLKRQARVYEVPIAYYGRTYAEGKKIFWYHGLEAILTLIKYRFVD